MIAAVWAKLKTLGNKPESSEKKTMTSQCDHNWWIHLPPKHRLIGNNSNRQKSLYIPIIFELKKGPLVIPLGFPDADTISYEKHSKWLQLSPDGAAGDLTILSSVGHHRVCYLNPLDRRETLERKHSWLGCKMFHCSPKLTITKLYGNSVLASILYIPSKLWYTDQMH